ncbi:hypothetical protein SD71_07585 [Cohnella kolymensis]|uniref:TPM domain-containing protein n=1 Tax=Cohnella kolymensis TaxID=1590652 RepID=A0ABR5A7C8_9BACL|nr:TPM domain-containing protein [Cohnella kolymensis]KIL36460.1 hypothetical protein SD71_07585 [Cohnella kolymensis]
MARFCFKICAAVWLLICGLGFTSGNAWAAQPDSTYGVYVQDEAGIISAQTKNELYSRAVWLHKQTGTAQIGIVTINELDNRSLEQYAVDRFREMGLGGKKRNDGVLLLYSAADKHVRLEIGFGLEGRIPDGKAGEILDRYFVPNRDAGQLDLAFSQTQAAVLQEIAAEYGVDTSGIENMPALPDQESSGFFDGMPGYMKVVLGIGVVFLIFLDFKFTGGAVTYSILNMLGRRGSGGGGYGSGRGGGRGGGGSSGGGGASR